MSIPNKTFNQKAENAAGCIVGIVFLGAILIAGVSGISDWYDKHQKETAKNASASTPVTPPQHCSMDHRFERLEVYPMNLRGDIALDSCTGKICRTWDWTSSASSPQGWKNHTYDPLCSDLVKSNP